MEGLPAKVQLHEEFGIRGVDVITVNVEGEAGMPAALEVLKKKSIGLTNWCLIEEMNDEVTDALQMDMLPALNVYDKKGRLRDTLIGEVAHDELEKLIEELLSEA